ncbi:MAG: SDR family NAD(P)-dependent oxidoreductase [Deltaproteobacteria bacterium]|nr:SDR family NAD(P)-dependent oxidoreductase [Deltaproteobacteria bacterium]
MSVAIFGATSRIARELARRFAERGETTILLARDAAEAAAIAADITVRTGRPSFAEAFDATDVAGAPALVARLEAAHGPITTAALAFGEMGDQAASQRDPAAFEAVVAANFTGAAALAEALAQAMTARGGGRIAAIGSVAGDRGRQSNYAYGSAKGALALYLEGLRNRLTVQKTGVHVLTVKLGFIDTRMTWGLATKIPIASPEAASRAILHALDRRRDTIYYPPFWRAIMGVIKAIPEVGFKRTST